MNAPYLLRLLSSIGFARAWTVIRGELLRRFYSNETASVLQFQLTRTFSVPAPSIPITVRTIDGCAVQRILSLDDRHIPIEDLKARIERHLLIRAEIPTCYMGVTTGGEPCVICWLIRDTENEKLLAHYKDGLMRLKPGEVLLEGIYVHREYRHMHLMRYLTFKLFEKGAHGGAIRALAYVKDANAVSREASQAIGWRPYITKKTRWLLFRRSVVFTDPVSESRNQQV